MAWLAGHILNDLRLPGRGGCAHQRARANRQFVLAAFQYPAGLTARLRSQGVKVVTIVDPGVKYQPPVAGAGVATAPGLTIL